MVAQGSVKRVALLAFLVACGSTADDASSPVAKTPRPAPTPDAPPAPAPAPPSFPILPYPAGPYGSGIGDTMADFTIQGYAMSPANRDPRTLPFRDIALSEARSNPACSCMVVVWAAAGIACHPSIQEDETLTQMVAADPSICVFESIFANGDEPPPSPYDVAAYPTRADLDNYTIGQREAYPVGIATESTFRALDGWTLAAHPLNFAVRPSDMKVLGFFTMADDLPGTIRKVCTSPQVVDTLATGLSARHVAVDDAYVYATDAARGVVRVPKTGGALETFATPSATPDAIALDATNVYWATHDGASSFEIGVRAKSGGAPAVLASSASGYMSIAVDATYVWYARADGEIGRVPIAGGPAEPVVADESEPTSIAVGPDDVFWIASGQLVRATHDGAARTTLSVTGQVLSMTITVRPVELIGSPAGIFVRGTTAEGSVVAQIASDGTMPAPAVGGAFPAFGLDTTGNVMAAFGSAMSPAALIGPFDATHGVIGFLTPGQRGVSAIGADGAFAYWANADGEIRRASR